MERGHFEGRAAGKRLYSEVDGVDRSYEEFLLKKLEREKEKNLRRQWEQERAMRWRD